MSFSVSFRRWLDSDFKVIAGSGASSSLTAVDFFAMFALFDLAGFVDIM
jgi:hypothetical protein